MTITKPLLDGNKLGFSAADIHGGMQAATLGMSLAADFFCAIFCEKAGMIKVNNPNSVIHFDMRVRCAGI